MLGIGNYQIGQKVYFWRANGEQTLGEIVKLNPTKAKVKTLESRGNGRGSFTGATWSVPYSLLRPCEGGAEMVAVAAATINPPLEYSPFATVENQIMEAIVTVYSQLSPENLTCDGELSRSQVQRKAAQLHRQLKGLQAALGRQVDEGDAWAWADSKRRHELPNE